MNSSNHGGNMKKQIVTQAWPDWMNKQMKELSKKSGLSISELTRRAITKEYKLKEPKIGG